MSFPVFQAACAVIIVLTLAAMARRVPWGTLLRDYFALALAGYLGEQSCIVLYHYYRYSTAWSLRVGDVPLLVPLIWPLVVMSARSVAVALWPGIRDEVQRAVVVAAIVAFDASLVEVVAVRAGLWSWAEPGHLGVPVIGILGWGYFAGAADYVLGQTHRLRHLLLLAFAPLVTHLLLVGSWWALFRHSLRADLGKSGLDTMLALGPDQHFHAMQKFAGNVIDRQAEEILDLSARNQHGDAVGEPDHHRPRYELNDRTHAAHAQGDEKHSRQQGAHEKAVDAILSDDARHHHDKRARGSANLASRPAQRGDDEPRHHGAVQAGFRLKPGRDGERHRQRQRHQAHRHTGGQVMEEQIPVVIPQAEDRLRREVTQRDAKRTHSERRLASLS